MFSFGSSIGSGVITAPVLVTGFVSTAILAGSVNGSLAAVTASVTNKDNKFGLQPGVVLVQTVTDGSGTCRSDSDPSNHHVCTDIDVFDETTNVATLDSTHGSKTLSFRQVNSQPLTSFSVDLGPCRLISGDHLCGTDPDRALVLAVTYSLDDGSSWVGVDMPAPAKTLADRDNILTSDQEDDIRAHISDTSNQVLFRFVMQIGASAEPGSQMEQDVTWSITG